MASNTQKTYLQTLKKLSHKTLQKNSTSEGILAGSTHFADLWARDALYASWGATTKTELEAQAAALNTLIKEQKNGQIPLRVGRTSMLAVLTGIPSPKGAVYDNDKNSNPALDPNSLFVITACQRILSGYTKKTEYQEAISKALDWLKTHQEGNLLRERSYASWDDALKKRGASVYNNTLYIHALKLAAKTLEKPQYTKQAKRTTDAMNRTLWEGSYFHAWEKREIFDVCGNLLAVALKVASSSQSTKILNYLEECMQRERDELPKLNYPAYPKTDTYLPFFLVGMGDYHNQGPYWTWISAVLAKAYAQCNNATKAQDTLKTLQKWIGNECICEIYDAPETPTKRLLYNSEKDFSWTAGLILWATDSIEDLS